MTEWVQLCRHALLVFALMSCFGSIELVGAELRMQGLFQQGLLSVFLLEHISRGAESKGA